MKLAIVQPFFFAYIGYFQLFEVGLLLEAVHAWRPGGFPF